MITILAEKPSVAREIARIAGATRKEEGFYTGNGYHVTWALGHLVQPALPEGYGFKGFSRDSLPVIPEEFMLIPRQVKTDKGYKADAAAVKQIKVITKLWNESDGIIVATDCAREGELVFRYLYAYTGCTLPFRRLWISSLTDTAIRKGLKELKDGHEYDDLYLAAKARSEADWLVGINGTQALTGYVFGGTRADSHAGYGLQEVLGEQTLYTGTGTPAAFLGDTGGYGYGSEVLLGKEMAGQGRGGCIIQ